MAGEGKGRRMHIRLLLALGLVFIVLGCWGCVALSPGAASSFDDKLDTIVRPYSFNFASWEYNTLLREINQRITAPRPEAVLNSQSVVDYFSYVRQLNGLQSDLPAVQARKAPGELDQYEAKISEVGAQIAVLKPIVEQTIARQIGQTLADQGIYNPFNDDWFKVPFPPVSFKLEKPLHVLVVSPRDKIERIRDVTLKPDLNTSQMEAIESSVEDLNVSALVVQIGGTGATYPSFVIDNADLRFTVDTAAEEWLHQYLVFRPLGFRYVLDLLRISPNAEIPTLNETVAGVASQELGTMVYNTYYAGYQTGEAARESSPATPVFDYNAAMRAIRQNVNHYLELGQVDQAEKYMEEQRQFLVTRGYYIRKLNQAYFAFYGSYAYSPTSIDPIGDQVRLLRKRSLSLEEFIDAAATMTSSRDLQDLLSQYQ
jgi:hypothetical protein